MDKKECRSCGSDDLKMVIDLGESPLANNLLNSLDDVDELYPLKMMYCPKCHNCQLSCVVPAGKMFDHYLYVSSTAKTFREHFELVSQKYISQFNLNENSIVVDIGSNDGIALKPLKEHNIKVIGVEPAKNISDIANNNGIKTLNEYFTLSTANKIKNEYGTVDLVTASNVFAHADDLKEMTNAVFSMLKPEGSFVVEVQYLMDTFKDLTFDNIYHEHVNYWSVTSLNNFFNNLGFLVTKVEHINTHGGSIRVYVQNNGNDVDDSVLNFLFLEEKYGMKNIDTYLHFAKRVEEVRKNVLNNINKLISENNVIVGYGSPAKATTSLNYYGITSNEIKYIIEDNPLKHGKVLPGVRIPIYSKSKLDEIKPDIVLVMAWNFFDDIVKNNQDITNKNIKLLNIKKLSNETI